MDTILLDPEIERLEHLVPTRDLSADFLAEVRASLPLQFPELGDAVERSDHAVDEANGVVVRVHRPVGLEGAVPCVYSIHGGGYIRGTYDMDDAKFDRWCPTYGIVGVSVEYRLSPETPYPGALEDCYAGLKWTYDNAVDIGIDPNKIGITGVSAGGRPVRRAGVAGP